VKDGKQKVEEHTSRKIEREPGKEPDPNVPGLSGDLLDSAYSLYDSFPDRDFLAAVITGPWDCFACIIQAARQKESALYFALL
jgi:hypothetical protein